MCVYSQRVHFNWFGCVLLLLTLLLPRLLAALSVRYSFVFGLSHFVFNIEWFLLPKWLMSLLLCVLNDGLLACRMCVLCVCSAIHKSEQRFACCFFQLGILLRTIQSIMLRSGCFDFFSLSFLQLNVGRRAPMMTLKANKIPKTHANKTYWPDQTPFFYIRYWNLTSTKLCIIHINKWIQIIYCMSLGILFDGKQKFRSNKSAASSVSSIEWDPTSEWFELIHRRRRHKYTHIHHSFYEHEDTLNRKITVFQFIKFHSIHWLNSQSSYYVFFFEYIQSPFSYCMSILYAICIDDGITYRWIGGSERCHYWVHDVVWMSSDEHTHNYDT